MYQEAWGHLQRQRPWAPASLNKYRGNKKKRVKNCKQLKKDMEWSLHAVTGGGDLSPYLTRHVLWVHEFLFHPQGDGIHI